MAQFLREWNIMRRRNCGSGVGLGLRLMLGEDLAGRKDNLPDPNNQIVSFLQPIRRATQA